MKFSQKLGSFFAHVQSTVDDVMVIILRKVKDSGAEPKKKTREPKNPTIQYRLKKGAKGVARFIGEMGESFYKTYENLKKEK